MFVLLPCCQKFLTYLLHKMITYTTCLPKTQELAGGKVMGKNTTGWCAFQSQIPLEKGIFQHIKKQQSVWQWNNAWKGFIIRIIYVKLKSWFLHCSPRGHNSEPTYPEKSQPGFGICGFVLNGWRPCNLSLFLFLPQYEKDCESYVSEAINRK